MDIAVLNEIHICEMLMFLLVVLLLVGDTIGNIDMYISKAEMNRTLGIHAELQYIEAGQINTYSTKFNYRVDAHIDHVVFTWSAAKKTFYSVRVDAEDMSVLPVLRIPHTGEVPRQQQEFAVEYRCAGHRAGQFVVSLHFNFSSEEKNLSVKLRQEKICASRDGRRGISGGFDSDQEYAQKDEFETAERAFYIIIGCAAAFLLIIAFLLVSYFRKSKKSGSRTPINRIPSFRSSLRTATARSGLSSQPFMTSTPAKESSKLPSMFRRQSSSVTSGIAAPTNTIMGTSSLAGTSTSSGDTVLVREKPNTIDVRKTLIALHANRDNFQMLPFTELEGTFGEVRFAIWRQVDDDATNGDVDDEEDPIGHDVAVVCKTLKKHASPVQLEKFLSDALVFHRVPPHSNLAQVVCAASFGRFDHPETVTDFPLICYRHQGFGNLRKFLLNCRDGDKKKGAHTLRTHELVAMCLQVTRAVSHLHKYGYLHKDIATRNCIVSESANRLIVQLVDGALSRDLFPQEYHCLGDNENRPVKWMAPETLAGNRYTSASDVWSLGVLCWELLTLGGTPFMDIDADDMLIALQRGSRLIQPNNCPDQLYHVMYCCWQDSPRDRPSSEQVSVALQDFTVQLNQFI